MSTKNSLPWTASQALAWIIQSEPLKLEDRQWTANMGPEIEWAQRKLASAIRDGQVEARGRRQPHGLMEAVPPGQFRIAGLTVIVGEHGDMRSLSPHKPYEGPHWQSIEFDPEEMARAFPKPAPPAAQDWMLNNANKSQKRDSLLKDCMKATDCTKRAAEAAYKGLPENLRRKRGKPARSA